MTRSPRRTRRPPLPLLPPAGRPADPPSEPILLVPPVHTETQCEMRARLHCELKDETNSSHERRKAYESEKRGCCRAEKNGERKEKRNSLYRPNKRVKQTRETRSIGIRRRTWRGKGKGTRARKLIIERGGRIDVCLPAGNASAVSCEPNSIGTETSWRRLRCGWMLRPRTFRNFKGFMFVSQIDAESSFLA